MSNKITENEIELFAIELLESLGFEYIYAPDIAPDSETPMRESFEDVILKDKLTNSLTTINSSLEFEQIEYAVKQCQRLNSSDLLTDNEVFHKMLTEGITVEVQRDGVTRGEIVKLIDFDNVSNNDFVVLNQFTILENGINKRPDLILFVNGLPLVVIELKNPVDENTTVASAYKQIQTYKRCYSITFYL
jgi:type I restriction enzyme R subunit